MKLLKKILVPIDVNIDSKEQINTTIKVASAFNSEVIIVYVIPSKNIPNSIKNLMITTINTGLGKVKKTLENEGINVREPIIEYGIPVDNILDIAIKENVNLILSGSGSNGKKEKFKLGTIAKKLVILSDKPVWTVKTNQKTQLSNILCPVDFSDPSMRALNNAILLSRKFNSKLKILSVYEPITYNSPRFKVDTVKENANRLKQIENEMEKFINKFDLKDIDYEIDIQEGSIDIQILKTIKEYHHDLLVMGTNGRTGLSKFVMGSTTDKVTRELPCSFITTKKRDIILKYDNKVKELEIHFKKAVDLVKSGFYNDAINEYIVCLHINNMHVPSMQGLAEVYKIIGDDKNAEKYSEKAESLLAKLGLKSQLE